MDSRNELFSKICRICLSINNSRTVPLFESNGNRSCYGQAILLCTNLELHYLEYAPQNMCYSCLHQLQQSILFKKKCKNTQMYFNNVSSKNPSPNDPVNIKENLIKQLYRNSNNKNYSNNYNSVLNKDRMENSDKRNGKNDNSGTNNDNIDDEYGNSAINNGKNEICVVNNDLNAGNGKQFKENVINHRAFKTEKKYQLGIDTVSNLSKSDKLKNDIINNETDDLSIDNNKEDSLTQNDNLFNLIENMIEIEQKKHTDILIANKKYREKLADEYSKLIPESSGHNTDLLQVIEENLNDYNSKLIPTTNKKNNSKKEKNKNTKKTNLIKHKRITARKGQKTEINNLIKKKRDSNNQNQPLKLNCDICHKVFKSKGNLKGHMELRHARTKQVVCELCGKVFATNQELRVHLVLTHDTGRHFPCDVCGHKAPARYDLLEHKRIHTGERPFSCDTCGLTFRRRYVWKQHLKVHTEKAIQCPNCPLKFHTVGSLRSHENSVHERKYMFNCHICGSSYAKNSTVRRHLIQVHGVAREKQGKIQRLLINEITT